MANGKNAAAALAATAAANHLAGHTFEPTATITSRRRHFFP
jgi:hypothetical protein